MSRKRAKFKSTISRHPIKPKKRDKLAYEVWLTNKANHGSMEDRLAAEGLLLKDLQRRQRPKRSKHKVPRRTD